jgi:hypothetical protein
MPPSLAFGGVAILLVATEELGRLIKFGIVKVALGFALAFQGSEESGTTIDAHIEFVRQNPRRFELEASLELKPKLSFDLAAIAVIGE